MSPIFTNASDYVAHRVFSQRVDVGGVTTWEVVDKWATGRVVASHDTKEAAQEMVGALREQRLAEVQEAHQ